MGRSNLKYKTTEDMNFCLSADFSSLALLGGQTHRYSLLWMCCFVLVYSDSMHLSQRARSYLEQDHMGQQLVSDVTAEGDFIIHVSVLFQILFPFRLLQSIEQSSLCYTVGLCWISILNIALCIFQSQTFNLSLPHPQHFPPGSKCFHK